MPIRRYRLVAILLAFFLALGPASSVYAMGGACTKGDSGMQEATGHSAHMQRSAHALGNMVDIEPVSLCPGCSSDCCIDDVCSSHACGTGLVALMTSACAPLNLTSGDLSSTDAQTALSERLTSLFRPPRA